jgi:hypothetical protein
MEFVSLVQAYNPFVKIEGTWLMDTSQDQGLRTALSALVDATTTRQKPDHPG